MLLPENQNAIDLSNLGVSELTAIINGDNFTFPEARQDYGLSLDSQPMQVVSQNTGPDTIETAQNAAETFMTSLNPPLQPSQPPAIALPVDPPRAEDEQNVDSLLAYLEHRKQLNLDQPVQPQESTDNHSFEQRPANEAEVDLSELVGLFSESTSEQVPLELPDAQRNIDALLTEAGPDGFADQIGGGETYDLNAIDLDDFNFRDSSMPNVEGDEFEELFAEFK